MLEVATNNGRPAVRGALDLLNSQALEAWLASFDGELTEVDLSGVTFFDSCALRSFLVVRGHNSNLRVVNPSKAVVKVLEITGTLGYLVDGSDVDW